MDRIRLQYFRLQRHFVTSVSTYDEVSLIDLSHSLRIWTEMAPELPRLDRNFETQRLFNTASPTKGLKRKIKNYKHVCVYFPDFPNGGIKTRASNGSVFKYSFDGPQEPMMANGTLMYNEPELCVYRMVVVHCERDNDLFEILDSHELERKNLENWLRAECVRINAVNLEGVLETFSITRMSIIKRLANVYEASHSSLIEDPIVNRHDYPIRELMKYQIGGLPLPYFAILKVANDIIINVPRIIAL